MPSPITRLATALVALSPHALATFSGGVAIGDLAEQADETTWKAAMAKPNAANAVHIPGYNISAKYSSTPQKSDDWGLLIGVTADIPTKTPVGKFFTGTTIRWMPPASLTQNGLRGDASWTVCMGLYRGTNLRTDREQINSTCEGLLPDRCVQALQLQASTNSVCGSNFVLPDNCRDAMGGDTEEGYGIRE